MLRVMHHTGSSLLASDTPGPTPKECGHPGLSLGIERAGSPHSLSKPPPVNPAPSCNPVQKKPPPRPRTSFAPESPPQAEARMASAWGSRGLEAVTPFGNGSGRNQGLFGLLSFFSRGRSIAATASGDAFFSELVLHGLLDLFIQLGIRLERFLGRITALGKLGSLVADP